MHINDNFQEENRVNAANNLHKIQPVLDHIRNNYILF